MNNLYEIPYVQEHNFEFNMLGAINFELLTLGENAREGHKFRYLIGCNIFSAFRLECLCNIFGNMLFTDWENKYERNKLIQKVKIISRELSINESDIELKIIQDIIDFRNEIAHLKPYKRDEKNTIKYSPEQARLYYKKIDELFSIWNIAYKTYKNNINCLSVEEIK